MSFAHIYTRNVATLALAVLTLPLCASVHAVEYAGIGGYPAYPRPDQPRSESIFIHTLEPDAVREEGVQVSNSTDTEKTILVNAVDSIRPAGGGFACAHRDNEVRKVGTWIAMETTEIVIAPGNTELVPFTITVPADARSGEHNACIIIEEKPSDTPGEGLTLSTRVGIRVLLTVPGDLVRELTNPQSTVATNDDGTYTFRTSVTNTGTTSVETDVAVRVRSLLFGLLYEKAGGIFQAFQDTDSEWNFGIDKPFWGGPYLVKTEFAYDTDGDGTRETTLKTPSTFLFVLPHTTALIIEIAVLFGILAAAVLLIRRRNKRRYRRMRAESSPRRSSGKESNPPSASVKRSGTAGGKRTRTSHANSRR